MGSGTPSHKQQPGIQWLFTMAWRDSRRNRSRLLLFMSSIVLGIAALVAIYSLDNHVRNEINDQAKVLLGADLMIENNKAADSAVLTLMDTLGNARSQECRFASMIYFKKNKGTRLVQVLALGGDYPYYGKFETTPASAATSFRMGQEAIVDKTLMLQYDAKVGDTIQLGSLDFRIAGILTEAPGRTGISTTIAAPVYIPYRYLQQTGLLQKGSRFNYSYYFKFDEPEVMESQLKTIGPVLERNGWDYETAESRKRDTGRQFDDVSRFLTLIGFIALLLGCIGIASSINIYIREKIPAIAILRCMGASTGQTFLIYLIQITLLGCLAAVAGALLGTVAQQILPFVLKDVLPLKISTSVSWPAVAKGIGMGVAFSFLFALLPLLAIRNISPLYTLRVAVEHSPVWRNPLQILLFTGIVLLIMVFARLQMQGWKDALVFTAGVSAALLLLTAVAMLLRNTVRRFFPSSFSYLWRQGFANLYRPNNQTIVLVVTIGLGTLFISTLYFMQDVLMQRVSMTSGTNQPNMILFDIQTSQKAGVRKLVDEYHLSLYQDVPIVTMRIEAINGKNAAEVKADSLLKIPARAFEGELRVTYRDTLTNTETLTAGKLATKPYVPGDDIYVSLEERYAKFLRVNVGDSMLFNVQGALIPAIVGSLRSVDWRRVQTNFRLVFPKGVLEDAPQFHVLVTRVPSNNASAAFQQAVVRRFPNVSIIDLGLILKVLDEVLEKISFVIKFMAAFSIVTGLIVLIASVYVSKFQRIQEAVLLRTIGASRKQVFTITALEYFFLGALAAGTGILLSVVASSILATYSFDSSFRPSILPVAVLFVLISLLTVAIGLYNSRSVVRTPPLEVLRKEV
ncbi:MAG TPA: FtsX-like permease family protein [Agriterribacter sp.]|nr:FtsX-like permease family protein [Agriterribacter sp.]